LRTWLTERLKQSIQHEYSQKLETYKAELKAEQEAGIERIRSVHSLAASAFTETRRAAQERRFNAIEQLWDAILYIHQKTPSVFLIMDYLEPEKYDRLNEPKFKSSIKETSPFDLAKDIIEATKPAESARLFAGEYLYSLLYAFRAMEGHVTFHLMHCSDVGKFNPWYQETEIRTLLASIFSEEELVACNSDIGI